MLCNGTHITYINCFTLKINITLCQTQRLASRAAVRDARK